MAISSADNRREQWPRDVTFLPWMGQAVDPHNMLIEGQIKRINQELDWVEIRTVTDEGHPMKGQKGLFANVDLEEETCLAEYTGELLKVGFVVSFSSQ